MPRLLNKVCKICGAEGPTHFVTFVLRNLGRHIPSEHSSLQHFDIRFFIHLPVYLEDDYKFTGQVGDHALVTSSGCLAKWDFGGLGCQGQDTTRFLKICGVLALAPRPPKNLLAKKHFGILLNRVISLGSRIVRTNSPSPLEISRGRWP